MSLSKVPTLRIGPYLIDPALILAPMAGVTDRPFRQLCKKLGAGLAVSEMVAARSFLAGGEKTKRRADHAGETHPCSVQIAGACPTLLAETARRNADEGAHIIDINMGCPAKKVCNTLSGSALLRDEALVGRILEAVVGAVQIPVTLKIRTGWCTESRNAIRIAQLAESCGIQALAIHGRTRNCFFKGEAEYDTIREVKSRISIPVIANGDINTPEQAAAVLAHTGADGIMIGRAAQGRPWIFQEIAHYLRTGTHATPPSIAQIHAWLSGHLERIYAFYGPETGVCIARKHVSWYTKGQHGSAGFRHTFNQITDATAQMQAMELFFQELLAEAA